jgi:hypothetical protein
MEARQCCPGTDSRVVCLHGRGNGCTACAAQQSAPSASLSLCCCVQATQCVSAEPTLSQSSSCTAVPPLCCVLQAKAVIEEKKQELAEAKLWRKRQEEYEVCAHQCGKQQQVQHKTGCCACLRTLRLAASPSTGMHVALAAVQEPCSADAVHCLWQA